MPTTHNTRTHNYQHTSRSIFVRFKVTVKLRMMRNKISYRRLTSTYEDVKEPKVIKRSKIRYVE